MEQLSKALFANADGFFVTLPPCISNQMLDVL
jgi:hypothetical protein